MIAVVGAMEEEVAEIKKYMDITSMQTIHGYTFYEGTIANTKVVVVQGGIGKVNAAISTTLLLQIMILIFLLMLVLLVDFLYHKMLVMLLFQQGFSIMMLM